MSSQCLRLYLATLMWLSLVSCGPRSFTEVLSEPISGSNGAGNLLTPAVLSAPSKGALRREGMLKTAKHDPAAAIRAIDTRLKEQNEADLRVAGAELSIKTAQELRQRDPRGALGHYLTAIQFTLPAFEWKDSEERRWLQLVYNQACAELAMTFREHEGDSSTPAVVPGPLQSYQLSWKGRGSGLADPLFYDSLRPTNYLKVEGFAKRNTQQGYGGALVGYHAGTPERIAANQFLAPAGWAAPLTAIVRIAGTGRAEVELFDLTEHDSLLLKGRRYPLDADFTAPIATLADVAAMEDKSILTLLRPDRSTDEGLYLLAPFKRDRIPLVLVHGLMSHPLTWLEVLNTCYADPVLRENYQLVVFLYPTGYPVAKNASELRIKMREFQKRFDPNGTNSKMKNMVMIGHSMGGILTNAQVRTGGDRVWNQLFDKPIDDIEMTAAERATLKELAYFKANPNITRVVFVCAPHRGSEYAGSTIGRLGSKLTKVPVGIVDFTSEKLLGSSTGLTRSFLADPTDSIDDLKVGAPVLDVILEQPMTYNPPYHSIVGDRGKGDGPESRSDGVVPYWSSHLDGAASEVIVPEGHSATNHPETVEEIRRILYLHLGKNHRPAPQSAR